MPESSEKGVVGLRVINDRFTSIHMRHCDVRKKLCKKGRGDQQRHPQRSPLRRFRPKKEGIVVTVGRRSAAGGRADARDAPREDAEQTASETASALWISFEQLLGVMLRITNALLADIGKSNVRRRRERFVHTAYFDS